MFLPFFNFILDNDVGINYIISMQNIFLEIKVTFDHSFIVKGFKYILNETTGERVPKYYHICTCVASMKDKMNMIPEKTFFCYQTKNKQEAFLIQKIFRDKKWALLSIKHPKVEISNLAKIKLSIFPDVSPRIKHNYLNHIPKKHLIKRDTNANIH